MHLGMNAEGKMVSIISTGVNLDLSSYVTQSRIHDMHTWRWHFLKKTLLEYDLLFLKLLKLINNNAY